jgi:hypothetical protein
VEETGNSILQKQHIELLEISIGKIEERLAQVEREISSFKKVVIVLVLASNILGQPVALEIWQWLFGN